MADEDVSHHLEKMKKFMGAGGNEAPPEEVEEQEVGEPDDDEDEIDVAPADRPSRAEKKKNRYRERLEAEERERQARIDAERRAAAWEQRAQMAEQARAAEAQRTPAATPEDEVISRADIEEDALRREYEARALQLGGEAKMSWEERNKFLERAKTIAERRDEAKFEKRAKARGLAPAASPQQRALEAKYADVFAVPNAPQWAAHELEKERLSGKTVGPELLDSVMDRARAQFGIGRRREESVGKRLGGAPRGASATREPAKKTLKWTPEFERMAMTRYKYEKDPQKRRQLFVRDYYKDET